LILKLLVILANDNDPSLVFNSFNPMFNGIEIDMLSACRTNTTLGVDGAA
jgi:hypothetical protein